MCNRPPLRVRYGFLAGKTRARSALTLLELIVVLAILVVLAGAIVPMISGQSEDARTTITQSSLHQVRDVILNRYILDMQGRIAGASTSPGVFVGLPGPDPGVLVPSNRSLLPQLAFLFQSPGSPACLWNSQLKLGWNGPYLAAGQGTYPAATALSIAGGFYDSGGAPLYGVAGDATVLDGWGNPIVIRLVSNEASGVTYYAAHLLSAGANGVLESTPNADGTLNTNGSDYSLLIKSWHVP